MTIRILLADDHRILLDGLTSLLEREADLEVVGTAHDGSEAVKQAEQHLPDIAIMDLSMPNLSGVEAIRRILAKHPETKIICLSMHAERQFVGAAFEAGAAGYILKDHATQEVVSAIHAVHAGESYLCSEVGTVLIEAYRLGLASGGAGGAAPLTHRESEVLQLIAEGFTAKEIGDRLCLSLKTVSTHRSHIIQKLGISSVAGLTKYAIRHGLTTVGRDHNHHQELGD